MPRCGVMNTARGRGSAEIVRSAALSARPHGAGQKLLWQCHGLAKQSQQLPGEPGCCGLINHTSRHGVVTTACAPLPECPAKGLQENAVNAPVLALQLSPHDRHVLDVVLYLREVRALHPVDEEKIILKGLPLQLPLNNLAQALSSRTVNHFKQKFFSHDSNLLSKESRPRGSESQGGWMGPTPKGVDPVFIFRSCATSVPHQSGHPPR